MKAKVLRRFLDKPSNIIHPVGKTIELTEERFEKIISAQEDPLIELIDEGSNPPGQTVSTLDLSHTVNELKEEITSELSKEKLESILNAEKEAQNRKGIVEHIESLLKEDDN